MAEPKLVEFTHKRTVVVQLWTETERGWGRRPDGCSIHLSSYDLKEFIDKYWAKMPTQTPDEYSYPDGNPYVVDMDLTEYQYERCKQVYGFFLPNSRVPRR